MEENIISVTDLRKTFRFQKLNMINKIREKFSHKKKSSKYLNALDGVSFSVKKGETLSIIGLNGSGKTTLLKIIAGIIKPTSGSVKAYGKIAPVLGIGTGFQKDLSARENIILSGLLMGIKKSEMEKKVDEIIEWAELERFSKMKLRHYSSGMRGRLAFGIVLQLNPDILLVDEVLSVGDKNFQEKSYKAFLSFREANKTIIHVTHNLTSLKEHSDRVLLLHGGKMIMIGNPDEVLEKFETVRKKK